MNTHKDIFKAPKKELFVGDFDLFLTIKESDFWKFLFTNLDKSIGIFFLGWFFLSKAILNHAFVSVMRTNLGVRQCGFLSVVLATSLLISINYTQTPILFKGIIGMFYTPISCFWKDEMEIKNMLWKDTSSVALKIYTVTLFVLGMFNSTRVHFFGYGNKNNNSRGDSWLFLGLKFLKLKFRVDIISSDKLKVIIESIIEPTIFMTIGFYNYKTDPVFSVVMILMACSEYIIAFVNKSYSLKYEDMLNR